MFYFAILRALFGNGDSEEHESYSKMEKSLSKTLRSIEELTHKERQKQREYGSTYLELYSNLKVYYQIVYNQNSQHQLEAKIEKLLFVKLTLTKYLEKIPWHKMLYYDNQQRLKKAEENKRLREKTLHIYRNMEERSVLKSFREEQETKKKLEEMYERTRLALMKKDKKNEALCASFIKKRNDVIISIAADSKRLKMFRLQLQQKPASLTQKTELDLKSLKPIQLEIKNVCSNRSKNPEQVCDKTKFPETENKPKNLNFNIFDVGKTNEEDPIKKLSFDRSLFTNLQNKQKRERIEPNENFIGSKKVKFTCVENESKAKQTNEIVKNTTTVQLKNNFIFKVPEKMPKTKISKKEVNDPDNRSELKRQAKKYFPNRKDDSGLDKAENLFEKKRMAKRANIPVIKKKVQIEQLKGKKCSPKKVNERGLDEVSYKIETHKQSDSPFNKGSTKQDNFLDAKESTKRANLFGTKRKINANDIPNKKETADGDSSKMFSSAFKKKVKFNENFGLHDIFGCSSMSKVANANASEQIEFEHNYSVMSKSPNSSLSSFSFTNIKPKINENQNCYDEDTFQNSDEEQQSNFGTLSIEKSGIGESFDL